MYRGVRTVTVGDGRELLQMIDLRSEPVDRGAPTVMVACFRAPERESSLNYFVFRRFVRQQLTHELDRVRPAAVILGIDATGRRRFERALATSVSLSLDISYDAVLSGDGELPAMGIALRSHQDRRVVASVLDQRRFQRLVLSHAGDEHAVIRSLHLTLRRLRINSYLSRQFSAGQTGA